MHLRARSVQKSRFYFKQQHIRTTFSKYTYLKTRDCTSLTNSLWFINCYSYICNQVALLHHSLPMSWMLLGFTGIIVQYTITASSSWEKPQNLSFYSYCHLEPSATWLSILNNISLFKTSMANHGTSGKHFMHVIDKFEWLYTLLNEVSWTRTNPNRSNIAAFW